MAVAPVALTVAAASADRRSFAGILVAAFAVVLPIALFAQALGLPWRDWFPGAEAERTLVGGVRAAVFSLMSHLI
jgi:light-harvesting complex 1 beta chain